MDHRQLLPDICLPSIPDNVVSQQQDACRSPETRKQAEIVQYPVAYVGDADNLNPEV